MSNDDLGLDIIPSKDDLKKIIKKNKSIVMPILVIVVLLAVLGPYYYMLDAGYSLKRIGYMYLAGMFVLYFLFMMFKNTISSKKKEAPKESIEDRRARAKKELDEIDKTLEAEAEVHRRRIAEIEASRKEGK